MLKALTAGALAWLIALCLPLTVLRTDASGTCQDDALWLSVEIDGSPVSMPLSDFLAGAVGGEMPLSYPDAALEAQAIAARTMVYRRLSDGSLHPSGAPVCTDPAHCMAWTDPSAFPAADEARLRAAVAATDSRIAVYADEPILAAFHAVSGGMTERAADVWGGDMPYLTNVYSPGEEDEAMYRTEHSFRAADFARRIHSAYPDAELIGDPASWFQIFDRSPAGGIRSISVGGVRVSGTALRALLELPSTDFTVQTEEDSLTLTCTGWGHGVGMSQAGAAAMARAGYGAEEIIEYYYPGAVCITAQKDLTS